jgi:hypothetical protein
MVSQRTADETPDETGDRKHGKQDANFGHANIEFFSNVQGEEGKQ